MTVFDISFWQDDNVIDKLIRYGAEGVILRLGLTFGGKPELDEKYAMFLSKARTAGLPTGLYYYSKMQNKDMALAEAQFINDKVYEYYGGDAEPELGVWFDMEDETTKIAEIHRLTMFAIKTMRDWYFKKVGIYASYSYFHDYLDLAEIEQRRIPVWVAQYSRQNDLLLENPGLVHHGWQFTETYDGQTLDGNEWYVKP